MNAHFRQEQHHCWFGHQFRWFSRRVASDAPWHRGAIISVAVVVMGIGGGPIADHVTTADAAIAGWCSTTLRPGDVWNTLTVDMVVKRQRLTSAGDPIGGPTPNATYRFERSSRTGSWKTAVTVLSVEKPPAYAFNGALLTRPSFPISRFEDDENGAPVRAYTASGTLISPTLFASASSAPASPRSVGQLWLDAFVAAPSKKSTRQQAFERAYGKASKAGTLNRYLHLVADGSDEVLVDPKAVVPVEANSTRNGKRISHRTFIYGPAPDSALVRTNVHADTVTSVSTGDHAVVDTTFSNICLELRR